MKDLIRIEEERLKKRLIIEAEFLNFKHCVENFILNTDGLNIVEEKIYSSLYKNDIERI
jgi:hypothetical protein